jgi:hypothetical protein
MKRVFFLVILGFFQLNTQGQTAYFNKHFTFYSNNTAVSFNVKQQGNEYILIGGTNDSLNIFDLAIFLCRIDSVGNLKYYNIIKEVNSNLYCGSGDGSYIGKDVIIMPGSRKNSGISFPALLKTNNNFDSLWYITYPDTTNFPYSMGAMVRPTLNGDAYILAGEHGVSNTVTYYQLLKTDTNGALIWRKYYGYGGNSNRCENLLVTPDGGFLMGGTTSYVYQSNSFEPMVVKVDSMGNQLWMKTYGGPFNDGYARLALAKDGNYVIGTTYQVSPYSAGVNRINFIKVDTSGAVLWNKQFCNPRLLTRLNNIKVLHDGSFIAVGDSHDADSVLTDHLGWIMKISEHGDSLWYREYSNYHSAYYWHELYDVAQTSDGGFIACGTINDNLNNLFYDMWVLKLDSNGCLNPGCTQSINEYGIRNQGIEIYPNPFFESFTLQMPEKIVEAEVYVFDMLGKQVMKTSINSHRSSIPASGLEKGIYLIRVVTRDGEVFIGKGVKN